MSEFDVLENASEDINKIRVADYNDVYYAVELIEKCAVNVNIAEFRASDEPTTLKIVGKEHAENLIKGLEKAIELGWLE